MRHYNVTLRNGDKILIITVFGENPPDVSILNYIDLDPPKQMAFDTMLTWAGQESPDFPTPLPPPDDMEEDIVDTIAIVETTTIAVSILPYSQNQLNFAYASLSPEVQDAVDVIIS